MKANDIIFEERGPKITSADLRAVEGRLGVVLPDDYKQFLLVHNGAWSKRCRLKTTGQEIRQWLRVSDSTKLPIYSIVLANENIVSDVPSFRDFLSIAVTLDDWEVIMSMKEPQKYAIGLWYPYGAVEDTPDKVPLPFASFTEFVENLKHIELSDVVNRFPPH
ncbi:MAG TPA: SMI1/KNR4 family protein [Planctomycetota bacterium]|nr:SMI1/KNR4 family protein [Planctomycetota bacterium]